MDKKKKPKNNPNSETEDDGESFRTADGSAQDLTQPEPKIIPQTPKEETPPTPKEETPPTTSSDQPKPVQEPSTSGTTPTPADNEPISANPSTSETPKFLYSWRKRLAESQASLNRRNFDNRKKIDWPASGCIYIPLRPPPPGVPVVEPPPGPPARNPDDDKTENEDGKK